MRLRHGRTGLIAGVAALIAAGACSKGGTAVDEGLKSDLAAAAGSGLELAPKAGSQSVVSAIEGGPTASPKRTPTRAPQPRVQKPAARPATRIATARAAAPSRVVTQTAAPAPVRAEPAAPAVSRPAPAPVAEQPGRVYKTEAEIFRQMPWIRP